MLQQVSPNRLIVYQNGESIIDRTITLNLYRKRKRISILWGILNVLLLSIVSYDLLHTCVVETDYFQYLEYLLLIIFTFNICYHCFQYIRASLYDENVHMVTEPKTSPKHSIPTVLSPFNIASLNWRSSTPKTPSGIRKSFQLDKLQNVSKNMSFECDKSPRLLLNSTRDSPEQLIHDEESLSGYLKGYKSYEESINYSAGSEPSGSILSSFWSHPAAKPNNEYTSTMKKSLYQVSIDSSLHPSAGESNLSLTNGNITGVEVWSKFNVNVLTLTQWTANIRMWLSQTILERLVAEFNHINDSLQKQGLIDVVLGRVSVERLRKTVQISTVSQLIPTLSIVIPFLDINSSNQEYIVQRIKELAQGGCMSDFRWNGGSKFNGKPWDDSLPTDSAIVMHLFVTYMDTQLLPKPNRPDIKPFTGYHYIKFGMPIPTLTQRTIAIQCVSEKPSLFRVIVGEDIVEMPRGYNNLFNSLLYFFYKVNKDEMGTLGRTSLGKSGINVLWVIES